MKKTKTRWSIAAQLLTKLLKRSLTERILNGPIRDSFCLFSFFSLSNDKILDQVQLCKLKSVDVVRGIRTRGRRRWWATVVWGVPNWKYFLPHPHFTSVLEHCCCCCCFCCSKSFTTSFEDFFRLPVSSLWIRTRVTVKISFFEARHQIFYGQSYKQFTLVIYQSRVKIWGIFKSGATLES